jgi:predicted flap endonuclease-1-like 5' DNA nuclease
MVWTTGTVIIALLTLIIGFWIGWLVEWILDNQYRRMRELQAALKQREGGEAGELRTVPQVVGTGDAESARTFREFLAEREEEVRTLRMEMQEREARYEDLEARFEAYMNTHPDELTAIKGIGRIYQWKLRDGGISTYQQLASTTPARIREILDVPAWRKLDPESWIEQAQVLARRSNPVTGDS